jgi:hypothetical protein
MGGWSVFDYIANVCRTVSDVLHICVYLLLVTVAILVAAHRYGSETYEKYVYRPLIRYLVKKNLAVFVKARPHGRLIPRIAKITIWSSSSNRLPYIVKLIKDFINKF